MREAGVRAKEPVELYEDPLRQKGPRPEYDFKDPAVRKALLDEAKAMPGPDSPNVYELGVPCTSYCEFAGDATLEVIGTLDWKEKRYMREPAKMMRSVLEGAPELCGEEPEVRIAPAELVCIVGFAAAEGPRWGAEVIAYATDNINVRSWLATRKSRTPMARHLLRILGMLEGRYRFRTLAFYIRTYHNVTADWVSREFKAIVEGELQAKGWTKVDPVEGWGDYLSDALRGVYRWPGDTGGLQVRGARSQDPIYRPVVAEGFCIEVVCGGRPWATAWQRIGGEELYYGKEREIWAEKASGPGRLWKDEAVKWVCCSITEDGWYYGRKALFACVRDCRPEAVLVNMPHRGPKDDVLAKLKSEGYGGGAVKVRTTNFGDSVAKVKNIIYAVRGAEDRLCWPMPRATCVAPNGIDKVLQKKGCAKAQGWVKEDAEVRLSRRISTSGDRMLPWPAGHVKVTEKEGKQLVYDIRGPALTPKKGKPVYLVDYGGEGQAVRRLSDEEEWIANGGDYTTLARLKEAGADGPTSKLRRLGASRRSQLIMCLDGLSVAGRTAARSVYVAIRTERRPTSPLRPGYELGEDAPRDREGALRQRLPRRERRPKPCKHPPTTLEGGDRRGRPRRHPGAT